VIEKSAVVKEIADSVGRSPTAVVLRWTVQRGIVVIPRSPKPEHIKENLECVTWELSDSDMAKLDALNEDHPYYWSPLPVALNTPKL